MPMTRNERAVLINLIKHEKQQSHKGWHNFSGNLNNPNALVIDIENSRFLSLIMKTINDLNQKKSIEQRIIARPAAGRHQQEYAESFTFTPEINGDVILRLVGAEFREIKTTATDKVMEVGASVQIGEADRTLYDKFNLSLPTSSLIPYVTVAGLAANAGHGTGLNQPSFSGLIKAMTICLPNGEITRIDDNHPDFKVIRGAHLGLFGIVLSLELECTEAKKMHCIMDVSTVPDFIQKIKDGLYEKYPYVSVMYVPAYRKNELTSEKDKNVIIYSWEPVDKSTPDKNSCPELSHLSQGLQIKLESGLEITDLMREFPHLIPYFTRHLVSPISIGKQDSESISPWYTMHYQTAFPRDIDDADYLFEVGKDHGEIITAFEKVVSTLTRYAHEKKYPVLDAVYLRLINGTNGGLSTSSHKPDNKVCGLDIVSSNGIDGYLEFKKEMADYFINGPLKGKPHWGKYVPLEVDYSRLYDDGFHQFIEVLNRWYAGHHLRLEHSMLLNNFHCEILKLPYRYSSQPNQFGITISHTNVGKTAHDLLNHVDQTEKAGNKFVWQLEKIDKSYYNNKDKIFFPSKMDKEESVNETENKNVNCCALL